MALDTLTIIDPALDGVRISGSGSRGRVRGCLIEFVPAGMGGAGGRFGVSTGGGARPAIESNTIVEAGDCALYVGGNSVVRANNLYRAHNFGAFFDAGSTAPTVTCNNAFQNSNGNYVSAGALTFEGNLQSDPLFCPGSYRLREISPLAPANSGDCGLIGAFPPDEGCGAPAAGRAAPRY